MSRRSLLLSLLAVAAAVAWFAVRDRDALASAAQAVTIAATDAAPSIGDARAPTGQPEVNANDLIAALADPDTPNQPPPQPAPPAHEPLPAWDAKLVDVVPMLRARADAGDMSAACHLGLALSSCSSHLGMRPSETELRMLDYEDKDAVSGVAMRLQDFRRPGREKTCDGLRDEQLDLRFEYLQRAADAGIRAAMIGFAEGIPLMSTDALVQRADWIETYRQRAPRYVSELLRRGDRWMAVQMYLNTDGMRHSYLAQALEMDAQTSATFWYLGRIVLSQPETPFQHGSPHLNQVARERAQALFGRYFESRALVKGEFVPHYDFWRVEACMERD